MVLGRAAAVGGHRQRRGFLEGDGRRDRRRRRRCAPAGRRRGRTHAGGVAAVDRILDLRLAVAALEGETERDLALEADAGALEQREDRRGVEARVGRRRSPPRPRFPAAARKAARRSASSGWRGARGRARAGSAPSARRRSAASRSAARRTSAAVSGRAARVSSVVASRRRPASRRRSPSAAAAGAGAGVWRVAPAVAASAIAAASAASTGRTRSIFEPNRSIVAQVWPRRSGRAMGRVDVERDATGRAGAGARRRSHGGPCVAPRAPAPVGRAARQRLRDPRHPGTLRLGHHRRPRARHRRPHDAGVHGAAARHRSSGCGCRSSCWRGW